MPSQTRPTSAAVILVLLTLLLAACGGSSSTSSSASSNAALASAPTTPTTSPSTSTAPSNTPSTAGGPAPKPKVGARTPKRATAPRSTNGAANVPAPVVDKTKLAKLQAAVAGLRACLRSRGMTIPRSSGTSQNAYTEALKQCIPSLNLHISPGGLPAKGKGANSLTKFIACMSTHGVSLPAPTASATGPVLNTVGVDTSSPKFKAAVLGCKGNLPGISELIAGSIGAHVGGSTP